MLACSAWAGPLSLNDASVGSPTGINLAYTSGQLKHIYALSDGGIGQFSDRTCSNGTSALSCTFSGTNGLVDSDARQVMYDDACQFWPNRTASDNDCLVVATANGLSFFRPDSSSGDVCQGEWRSLKLSATGIPSDEINRMHYHAGSGRLWMATSGGGMASCKFGSDPSRSGPYLDNCDSYRSSNTDFVVTNDVIDFQFLYEGSSAEMLWTLSRPVTEADGSTSNGGVGLLKANGEEGEWPLPSDLQRPLDLEASRAVIAGTRMLWLWWALSFQVSLPALDLWQRFVTVPRPILFRSLTTEPLRPSRYHNGIIHRG